MAQSALHHQHESSGATMGEYGGWSLPRRYTDPAGERHRVRSGAGVIDLSHRGRIRITGKDRQTFLQGMVSNDTRELDEGRGLYATILEPKGHMRGDLTLYAFPDFYLADTEPGMAAPIARMLDRYIIREKVTLKAEDEGMALIGVSGPEAGGILRSVLPECPALPSPFGCAAVSAFGTELLLMRRDFTGEESYQIALPAEAAPELWTSLVQAGAQPFGMEALEILRVEAGIPRYGQDLSEEVIPLEAGLEFGISRDKGCYIGQEVIERISSRGHTNRRLLPLRFSQGSPPEAGTELFLGEKKVGAVTSAVHSPGLGQPVGLGYVRRETWDGAAELKAGGTESEVTAVVLKRPAFGSGEPPAIRHPEEK
ncbi:MAG: aminomethyltransferase family protein [Armatimonadetes bacterium]|nr:aminomethyltransferase family protein [Armatimonadota bacterium]